MEIRPAKSEDYQSITKIRGPILSAETKNKYELSQSGFLTGDYKEDEFNSDLQETFLVALEKGELVGYIVLSRSKEYRDNDLKIWCDEAFKKQYYSSETIEMKVLFVSKTYRGNGIGSKLVESAVNLSEKKYKRIASIITFAPIVNYRSLNYHLFKNFRIIAVSLPQKLFDMENYQSFLLMKNL